MVVSGNEAKGKAGGKNEMGFLPLRGKVSPKATDEGSEQVVVKVKQFSKLDPTVYFFEN